MQVAEDIKVIQYCVTYSTSTGVRIFKVQIRRNLHIRRKKNPMMQVLDDANTADVPFKKVERLSIGI